MRSQNGNLLQKGRHNMTAFARLQKKNVRYGLATRSSVELHERKTLTELKARLHKTWHPSDIEELLMKIRTLESQIAFIELTMECGGLDDFRAASRL